MILWSLVRRLMFADMKKIVLLAREKVLQPEDMPALPRYLSPRHLPVDEARLDTSGGRRLIFSAFRLIMPFAWPAYALSTVYVALNLTKPVLVNTFVTRLSAGVSNAAEVRTGVLLALALGFVSFAGSLTLQHYFLRILGVGQLLTNVINRLVYRRSLFLTQAARGDTQLGDIVNHLGTDSDAVSESPQIVGDLLLAALTIVGAVTLLFYYLGITALLSVALLLLLAPLSQRVARSFAKLDEELMRHRDERVTLMGQILNGIRVVKYFAWEKSVRAEVGRVRERELDSRRRMAEAEALATLSYVAVSTVVLFASLALHVHRGFPLTPALTFTCVAVFAILEEPVGHLSELISRLAAAFVAASRVGGFLRRETLPFAVATEAADSSRPGILLRDLTVRFHQTLPALDQINLTILPGQSVAVVGPVGAGKSTLLQAILRELPLAGGALSFLDERKKELVPRIAYVPQEAFIVNGSLRENLGFGESVSEQDLQAALFASCLAADIPQLPAGLFTEIGEKGVNLSGGQKQRVSLARAILRGPTLALLDDPLAAVDSRTEGELMDRLLFGTWREITRVVVTHRLAHLDRFDQVVFLVAGRVVAAGKLDELLARSEAFRAFFAETNRAEAPAGLATSRETTESVHSPATAEVRVTEDEERAVGAVRGGVYVDYLRALGGYGGKRGLLVITALLATSVLASVLPLAQKTWLAYSANLQGGGTAPASLAGRLAANGSWSVLVYGCLGLLTLTGVLVNRLFWLRRGMAAGRALHDRMLTSVLAAPLRFFDSTPVGRVLQRFSRDVESVDIQLQWSFETTVRCLVNIATALFLILGVLPWLLVLVLPVLWLYYLVQRDYRIPAREAKRLDSISRSPRFAHFKETLQGLVVIRSFGRTESFFAAFLDRLEHGQRMFYGHYMLNRWFSSRVPLLGGLVASGTGLGLVYYTAQGRVSAGVAGLLVVYSLTLWESLNWAVRIFSEVEARMTSVERLRYYGSLESERDVISAAPTELAESWPSAGALEFDQVQARYASHLPPVLKGISFRVPAGARVGIIGRTGSGKSTLLQALYRCMELESGAIRIDGIDIAQVPLSRLRRSLAIIPQDPTLFLGTLRSNLDRYAEYTDEAIWAALEQARLEAFVRSLPDGLLSPVKENGANFSQGQRQLLCLARALLARARVVVMDEATASVDVQTDSLVQEVVRQSLKGITILIIAHRLGTVADCDLILEVREGRLHRSLEPKSPAAVTALNPA